MTTTNMYEHINVQADRFADGDITWYTELADFIKANGGNDEDLALAFEECEGMDINEAKRSRMDYGMMMNPKEVKALILKEAQQRFRDFVDYMNHDMDLIMTQFDLGDHESAEEEIRIVCEDNDLELQDGYIDMVVREYYDWLLTTGYRYI